jgi:hypothetical protein
MFAITEDSWTPSNGGTLKVVFTPTEERTFNASITFSSQDATNKTVTLTGNGGTSSGDFFEDFETMTGSGAYTGAEVTFASGLWYIKGYTTMDANDRYNGTRSIRLRGNASDVEHRAEMLFDKTNGAGIVSFKYGSYSSHAGGQLQLQTSTDQGTSWQDKGAVITVPSWTGGGSVLQTASVEVNQDGNIRIRIIKINAAATSSVNIDDIEITDFGAGGPTLSVTPMNLAFGNVDIQTVSPEKTVSISGSNLTGNITYIKGGADADAFTISENSWNPAIGGTLTVTFAPVEVRVYNALITISSPGTTDKVVNLTGTGIDGASISCNGGFEEWTNNLPNCWVGTKTTFAHANIVQYSANVIEGNYACQLINAESAHKRFTTQSVTVKAGETYTITFWAYGKGNIRTALFDERETNNGYSIYNEYILVDSETWGQYSQTVVAENNSTAAEFVVSVANTDESKSHIGIDKVTISAKTAIDEISQLQCFVYPNPTNGLFYISVNTEADIHVYSITGILLYQQKIVENQTVTVNLEQYPAGIYILQVINKSHGIVTKKIVIQ